MRLILLCLALLCGCSKASLDLQDGESAASVEIQRAAVLAFLQDGSASQKPACFEAASQDLGFFVREAAPAAGIKLVPESELGRKADRIIRIHGVAVGPADRVRVRFSLVSTSQIFGDCYGRLVPGGVELTHMTYDGGQLLEQWRPLSISPQQ